MNIIAHAFAWAAISPKMPERRIWATIALLGSLSACIVVPSKQITFSNPPSQGQSLPNSQRFFACQKISGARYMASTGFMIAGCKALQPNSAHNYRVNEIRRINLPEGEMWQIQLIGPEGPLWMPLPWHDWA